MIHIFILSQVKSIRKEKGDKNYVCAYIYIYVSVAAMFITSRKQRIIYACFCRLLDPGVVMSFQEKESQKMLIGPTIRMHRARFGNLTNSTITPQKQKLPDLQKKPTITFPFCENQWLPQRVNQPTSSSQLLFPPRRETEACLLHTSKSR